MLGLPVLVDHEAASLINPRGSDAKAQYCSTYIVIVEGVWLTQEPRVIGS